LEKEILNGQPMRHLRLEEKTQKRSSVLVHALIISAALNLGLIATFITFILKERRVETLLHPEKASTRVGSYSYLPPKNADVMAAYAKTPFASLVAELENDTLLEQGFRGRDLALAALVSYYYFDVERALPGIPLSKRPFFFSDQHEAVDLIAGLDFEKFQAIRYFAQYELWPFTSEGLFKTMQSQKESIPPSLKEAFCMSKEFFTIERAFSRLPYVFTRDTLLHLLLDGQWELLQQTAETLHRHPHGEFEHIGPFLAGLKASKLAAYLLIALDPDYPYLTFSHEELEHFISKLDEQTEEATAFLERVASSLRPDDLKEKAAMQIRHFGKEVILRSPSEEYIIQKGDSLWSLSQQFGVSIEDLRVENQLESDLLTPGKVLKIPENF